MENTNTRWAFNTTQWQQTIDDIMAASSFIQLDEKERISKFYFQNDAKMSLIGRLMLRKYISKATSIPYDQLILNRDANGKPTLDCSGDIPLWFNVSHQGDYVVLAGSMNSDVGIDIMKIEPPVNKDITEFLKLMSRQLSDHEWATIRSFPTEMKQIECFYRVWCLKESYVKNLGCGITVPLKEISFSIKTRELMVGNTVLDTEVYRYGVLQKGWMFEEMLLDQKHIVVVSLRCQDRTTYVGTPFTHLNFKELVREAKSLHDPDGEFSSLFTKKEIKEI